MSISRTGNPEALREARFGAADGVSETSSRLTLAAGDGGPVVVPDEALLRDGEFLRQGGDLVIRGSDGAEVVVQGYFAAETRPNLTTAGGDVALSPGLVDSFLSAMAPGQYAQAAVASAQSPIGQVDELKGEAFAVRADGTRVQLAKGDSVFEGDIVETGGGASAIRMVFLDKTMFALGSDARLALDELVFNPSQSSGSSQFSILKGVFIFSSGEIAKTDNTEMTVITPVAAIGIRGTEVAGRVDGANSQFTIIDGAIEVTTQAGSVTQDKPGETTLVSGIDAAPSELFVLSAAEYGVSYGGVTSVAPRYFTFGDKALGNASDEATGDTDNHGQSGAEDRGDAPSGDKSGSADGPVGGAAPNTVKPSGGDVFSETLAGSAKLEFDPAPENIGALPPVGAGSAAGAAGGGNSVEESSNTGAGVVPAGSGGASANGGGGSGGSTPAGAFKFELGNPAPVYSFSDVAPAASTTLTGSKMNFTGVNIDAEVKYEATGTGDFKFELYGVGKSVEDIVANITVSNFDRAGFKLDNGAGSKITVDSADLVIAETGTGEDRLIFNGSETGLSELTFKGGLGIDTLQLSGPGQTFDLGSGIYNLTEVEQIDLTGGSDAVLKLGANILSKLKGSGLNELSGTDDTLVISGDLKESVEFANGASWSKSASPQTINGESYSVYGHASGSQVLVQDVVTTNI